MDQVQLFECASVAALSGAHELADALGFSTAGGRLGRGRGHCLTVPVSGRVLAALGPKMLELAGERADGAHPYNVNPEHTAEARGILGPGPYLCPEQAVVLETDPTRARKIGRDFLAIYLGLPNYTNNFLRLGFDESDFKNGGSDRLIDNIIAWGDLNTVRNRIRAHQTAGADHICIQVLTASPKLLPLAEWRELAPALLRD